MVSVKTCLEAIMKEVGEVKRALAETHEEVRANEARAAAAKKAASGAVNRAEEQFNHQRAILNKGSFTYNVRNNYRLFTHLPSLK